MINTFSRRMRIRRSELRYTLEELSKKTKIGTATLQRYETGASEPTMKRVKIIADALETSLNYLVGIESASISSKTLDIIFSILPIVGFGCIYNDDADMYILYSSKDASNHSDIYKAIADKEISAHYIDPIKLFQIQNEILSFSDFKVDSYITDQIIEQEQK